MFGKIGRRPIFPNKSPSNNVYPCNVGQKFGPKQVKTGRKGQNCLDKRCCWAIFFGKMGLWSIFPNPNPNCWQVLPACCLPCPPYRTGPTYATGPRIARANGSKTSQKRVKRGAKKSYTKGQNGSKFCQTPLPDLPNCPQTCFFELPDPKIGG